MSQAGERGSVSVLAVDYGSVSVGPQVVMGALMIHLLGKHEIRCRPFVREVMLVPQVNQVGLVINGPREIDRGSRLIDLPPWIAGCLACVGPAEPR